MCKQNKIMGNSLHSEYYLEEETLKDYYTLKNPTKPYK